MSLSPTAYASAAHTHTTPFSLSFSSLPHFFVAVSIVDLHTIPHQPAPDHRGSGILHFPSVIDRGSDIIQTPLFCFDIQSHRSTSFQLSVLAVSHHVWQLFTGCSVAVDRYLSR